MWGLADEKNKHKKTLWDIENIVFILIMVPGTWVYPFVNTYWTGKHYFINIPLSFKISSQNNTEQ